MDGKLDREARARLWLRLGVRAALAAAGGALVILVGLPLLSLFLPFVLALALSAALEPAVRRLRERFGVSRQALAAGLVAALLAVAGGLLAALGYALVSEVTALTDDWQGIWAGATALVGDAGTWLAGLFDRLPEGVEETVAGVVEQGEAWVQGTVAALLDRAAAWMGSMAVGLPSFAVGLAAFVMGACFLSADYPRLLAGASRRLPEEAGELLRQVKRAAMAAFGGYLRAQLILTAAVFVILLLGFLASAQPYAVLLAFLLAVLDFIPILGSGTVLMPWAAAALMGRDYPTALRLMVIWGVVAVFRQAAEPRVVGGQTGLSPITSLMSIYVGMRLAGVPGMIFGPVVCMVGANLCRLGVLDGALADLRLAAGEVRALLKNGAEN